MNENILLLQLTKTEYETLKEVLVLDEGAEAIIENAKPAEGGFALSGSWDDFDDLAGYVAAEANHTESQRKQDFLDKIYDKIEGLLGQPITTPPGLAGSKFEA